MDDPLETQVRLHIAQGYRLVVRGERTAQMVRPKTFNLVAALLWFLCFGVGVLVYVGYYLSKQDDAIYLSADVAAAGPIGLCRSCGYRNVQPRRACKRCHAPLIQAVA